MCHEVFLNLSTTDYLTQFAVEFGIDWGEWLGFLGRNFIGESWGEFGIIGECLLIMILSRFRVLVVLFVVRNMTETKNPNYFAFFSSLLAELVRLNPYSWHLLRLLPKKHQKRLPSKGNNNIWRYLAPKLQSQSFLSATLLEAGILVFSRKPSREVSLRNAEGSESFLSLSLGAF